MKKICRNTNCDKAGKEQPEDNFYPGYSVCKKCIIKERTEKIRQRRKEADFFGNFIFRHGK